MILYHGGIKEIKTPKIIKQNSGRDFGFAFYTTDIKEQAENWAKRKAKIQKNTENKKAIVNIYEFIETPNLKIKKLDKPNKEWLDMVINCRSYSDFIHGYDIVIGKIANDRVGETIAFVLKGVMRKEDAIERLKFQNINNQIAFCTNESLNNLKFIKSYFV